MTAKIGGVLLVAVLAAGCAFAYVNEDCDWRDRSEAREIAREAREHAREIARQARDQAREQGRGGRGAFPPRPARPARARVRYRMSSATPFANRFAPNARLCAKCGGNCGAIGVQFTERAGTLPYRRQSYSPPALR